MTPEAIGLSLQIMGGLILANAGFAAWMRYRREVLAWLRSVFRGPPSDPRSTVLGTFHQAKTAYEDAKGRGDTRDEGRSYREMRAAKIAQLREETGR